MYGEFAWLHGALCTGLFLLCFLLLRSQRLWYLAAGAYLLNIVLVVAYIMVSTMTGAGFNEAALYYLINASWKDVALLTAYDAVLYGIPAFIGGALLFTFGVRKVRLPHLLPVSLASQTLLVIGTSVFGLYMTPLAADVNHTVIAAGLDKRDRIGLQDVAARITVPKVVQGPKKNLILLYAESMEKGLFDENLFPGLLPKLNRLSAQGVRFEGINQSPMSDWTIAGMIATQCGVPLSSHRMLNESNDFQKFSTAYHCLGNHLAIQGHWRVYMGGASNKFAGKGEFYRSMGFDEILGLDQLAGTDSPQSKWGIYDDELLPKIRSKIDALRASQKMPFTVVALTLDSHPPAGYASPTCASKGIRYAQGKHAHLNAIHCSDDLLTELLEQLIRDNIHDSTIVLLSDHLMMQSQASELLLDKRAPRRNFMVIWDRELEPRVVGRSASQFDVASTVLQVVMNRSVQVGFGTSMLDVRSNLTELHGQAAFDESVYAWRTNSWSKW